MDGQGQKGSGHVLSVTWGSMHYIVQDKLSHASFMQMYAVLVCVYVCVCVIAREKKQVER